MADQIYDIGSGRTYSTLQAAITAAIAAGVTADDYYFQIYGQVTGASTIGSDDLDTTATHIYIEGMTADAELLNTSNYQVTLTILWVQDQLTIRNLKITESGTNSSALFLNSNGANPEIHRCRISGVAGINKFGTGTKITSSIIENCSDAGIVHAFSGAQIQLSQIDFLNNNSAITGVAGITYNGDSCVFYGNTTDWDGTGTWSGDYNASDGTAPGTNGIDSLTSAAFNNAAGGDYSLSGTGSVLYHAGVPIAGLTEDFVGNTFDASTPSVGAYEYLTAGAGLPPSIFQNSNQQVLT